MKTSEHNNRLILLKGMRRLLNTPIEPLEPKPVGFHIPIKLVWAIGIVGFLLSLPLILTSCSTPSMAYTDEQAIRTIIGEAENQGYEGMLAVACAIRNRGTLKGVYGLNNPRVVKDLYSNKVMWNARKAWFASYEHDITNGAKFWENTTDFGYPYWVKHMVKTFQYKAHTFYKEII